MTLNNNNQEAEQSIILYGFPKHPGIPSGSAFCQKLETYYRFAGITYVDKASSPVSAPKGKLPYVQLPDGTILADSHFIIRHAVNNGGKPAADLDTRAGLTDLEKADGNAYRCYIEDHVYPAIVYTRWTVPQNFHDFIEHEFKGTTWIYRKLISNLAQYSVTSALRGHGIGRHSLEEVESILKLALGALETRMKENQKDGGHWFFGAKGPAEIDASLYGVLATTATTSSTPSVKRFVASSPIFSRYVLAITQEFYPEFKQLIAAMEENIQGFQQ